MTVISYIRRISAPLVSAVVTAAVIGGALWIGIALITRFSLGSVVLFVLFVARVLGGDGAEVGLLRGVQAVGGIIGGLLVVGPGSRLAPGRLLGASLLAFGGVALATWNAPGLSTAVALYVGLFVAASLPAVAMLSGLTALVQTETLDAYLGRVLATYLGTFNGLQAVGMLLAGLLGDALGVVQVLNGQAALYLLAGVVALLTLGRRRRIAPARTPPAGRAAATGLGGRRQARTSKPVRMPLA